MKKLKAIQIAIAVSVLLFVAPVSMVGCKSANQTSYRVTGVAQVSADTAMRAWGAYVSSAHPPVETELKVQAAFNRYKALSIVVVDAGRALAEAEKSKLDPSNARSRLDLAIAAASASLGDLTQLITVFGVNLKAH